jgi:hypothetical protein
MGRQLLPQHLQIRFTRNEKKIVYVPMGSHIFMALV